MHVEDGILKVFFTRKNRNEYPREENNCGNESSKVLLYGKHLGDTNITENTYLSKNIILETRNLVLSYLQIGQQTGNANHGI